MVFFAGCGKEKITPPLGTLLYGYRPDVVSDTVHDDLTVTAAAFGDGEATAILISADVGDIATEIDVKVRESVGKECGISPKNIVLAATHTHCAPNISGVDGWGEINREYLDNIFLPAVISASRKAVSTMAEAELGTEEGCSDIGINRREYTKDCNVILGQNPWGLYDPYMTVTRIRRRDNGEGILTLIHYGCHGTACGCSTVITRDWAGMMIDRVEKLTGTAAMFINGAIGDVGPRLTNGLTVGDISYVEELGSHAAMDAVRLVNSVCSYTVPKLTVKHGNVRMPYQSFPSLEEIRARKLRFSAPDSLINVEALEYGHLCEAEKILTGEVSSAAPEAFTFEQTVISVGDIVIVPMPFEIFSEISLRMRKYSGYRHTLCLSCAGGYNGYLPSQDQLCRGGYEVAVFRFASLYSLADNSDDNIVNESLRIIGE